MVASACDLGESPSWDGAAQKLLFVDINGKTIYIWDGSSTGEFSMSCSNQICALAALLRRSPLSKSAQMHFNMMVASGAFPVPNLSSGHVSCTAASAGSGSAPLASY